MYKGENNQGALAQCTASRSDIEYRTVKQSLWQWIRTDAAAFNSNFSMDEFKRRYASDDQEGGNPFLNSTDLDADNYEWQMLLQLERRGEKPIPILRCPEDVVRGKTCDHPAHALWRLRNPAVPEAHEICLEQRV